MKNSLFLTVHSLTSDLRVGSYYYFKSLTSSFDSVEVRSAPLSLFHLVHRSPLKLLKEVSRIGYHCYPNEFSNVSFCSSFSLIPCGPMNFFSSDLIFNSSYRFTFPKSKLQHYDLIYCDNPFIAAILFDVTYNLLVFRVPDLLPPPELYPALDTALDYLMKNSSLVIVASTLVEQQIKQRYGVSAKLISNGVDTDRFRIKRVEVDPIARKTVVFVGVFDYWIDLELLRSLADTLPHIKFLFIGPTGKKVVSKLTNTNVHFTGSKHPSEVAQLLSRADVGVIPFDTKTHRKFVDGINPLKAYEYLAAGIPVVSTDFTGVRGISPYVTTASSPAEFCQAVKNYLDNPPDRDAVRKTAEPYDWSVVLKPFEDFVKKSLDKRE